MIQFLKRFIRRLTASVKPTTSIDIASQDALLSLMKYYRIRVVVQGRLYIDTIKAKDIDSAFKILIKKAADGLLKVKEGQGFYQQKKVQITYEEVKDGTSGTGANETGSRTQMGQEGFDIAT